MFSSMPMSKTATKVILAAGCAGLGAATILLIKYLQQRRDIQFFREELDRLSRDLEEVRREVRALTGKDRPNKPSREHEIPEIVEVSSQSDAEYFDASEDLDSGSAALLPQKSLNGTVSREWAEVFQQVDRLLDSRDVEEREEAYKLMKSTAVANKRAVENCDFLWRYSRATYLYGQSFMKTDEKKRKNLVFQAKDLAFDALKLNDKDPDVHKWCALTLGTSTEFLGLNEKIQKGYDFKHHIDRALSLNPKDPVLHHLCGRWCYEVANLSWIERKLASTLFSEPPTATYDEALNSFLEAEKLQPDSWPENLLFTGKTYLAKGETEKAIPFIRKTLTVPASSADDEVAQDEAKYLLSKY